MPFFGSSWNDTCYSCYELNKEVGRLKKQIPKQHEPEIQKVRDHVIKTAWNNYNLKFKVAEKVLNSIGIKINGEYKVASKCALLLQDNGDIALYYENKKLILFYPEKEEILNGKILLTQKYDVLDI